MKKVVIITGANGDIGTEIVTRLLTDGYRVIGMVFNNKKDHQYEELQKKYQADLITTQLDLSKPEEIEKAFSEIAKNNDAIYGLVNNAGVYPIIPFESYTLDDWNRVITLNMTAPFLCTQHCLHLMKKDGGSIGNISSTAAHLGSRDVAYSASKSGLIGLTKSTARSLAQYKIRVNAIAPGTIDTKMSQNMKEEDRQKNAELTLLKRLGVPDDVSGVVAFLLSQDSKYMTGCTLDINGGLHIR